jgi:hypothetical protein
MISIETVLFLRLGTILHHADFLVFLYAVFIFILASLIVIFSALFTTSVIVIVIAFALIPCVFTLTGTYTSPGAVWRSKMIHGLHLWTTASTKYVNTDYTK